MGAIAAFQFAHACSLAYIDANRNVVGGMTPFEDGYTDVQVGAG